MSLARPISGCSSEHPFGDSSHPKCKEIVLTNAAYNFFIFWVLGQTFYSLIYQRSSFYDVASLAENKNRESGSGCIIFRDWKVAGLRVTELRSRLGLHLNEAALFVC